MYISVTGIASAEAFGAPALRMNIKPVSIDTGEAFGTAYERNLRSFLRFCTHVNAIVSVCVNISTQAEIP